MNKNGRYISVSINKLKKENLGIYVNTLFGKNIFLFL